MEVIEGKKTRQMSADEFQRRRVGYRDVLVDLGTGDGKFVLHAARKDRSLFVIGIDACRENLREASRGAPENALFVIAAAQALPEELFGLAGQVTIHFPWGSLRDGLLLEDPVLLESIHRLARPGAVVEVHLNASALAEAGWELLAGGYQVQRALGSIGCRPQQSRLLTDQELRAIPTTWARRLSSARREPGSPAAAMVATAVAIETEVATT